MPYLLAMRMAVVLLILALAACAKPPPQLANPASVNCAKVGGRLVVERGAAGGEFGVCLFPDNRQCEEWALFRGHCPVGGVRVAGYVTDAARHCGIRGGDYRVTAAAVAGRPEQDTCTLPGGKQCDVHAQYAGKC